MIDSKSVHLTNTDDPRRAHSRHRFYLGQKIFLCEQSACFAKHHAVKLPGQRWWIIADDPRPQEKQEATSSTPSEAKGLKESSQAVNDFLNDRDHRQAFLAGVGQANKSDQPLPDPKDDLAMELEEMDAV